jgi:hypothetical protein
MDLQIQQIKNDYKKYLRHIAEQYNFGEDGKFPPDVNSDRMLEFDEYVEWWKARQTRIHDLKLMFERVGAKK